MTRKIKPVKLAPGKYQYKGHIIRQYGIHGNSSVTWKAFDEETEELKHTGHTLHEVVDLINKSC